VPRTAAAEIGQFCGLMLHELQLGHLRHNSFEPVLCGEKSGCIGLRMRSPNVEETCHQTEQLSPLCHASWMNSPGKQGSETLREEMIGGQELLLNANAAVGFLEGVALSEREKAAKQVRSEAEPVKQDLVKLACPNHRFHSRSQHEHLALAQGSGVPRVEPVRRTFGYPHETPCIGSVDPFLARQQLGFLDPQMPRNLHGR